MTWAQPSLNLDALRTYSMTTKAPHEAQDSALSNLNSEQRCVIKEEEEALSLVMKALGNVPVSDHAVMNIDEELLALRDQLKEARLEDQAALLDHMNRLQAIRQHYDRREEEQEENDFISSPYFGRIAFQLYDDEGELTEQKRTFYIGKRSFVSKDGSVKVVDWRSSPVSRLYYLFTEGDDFYESIGEQDVDARLKIRRTLSVKHGELKRVQYGKLGELTLTKDEEGWGVRVKKRAQLGGGQGVATRVSTQSTYTSAESLLPEITAMIDPEQFRLITHEQSGVVIIQGGAGTGKTTIALHRVAYLHFQNPSRFRPEQILMLTPGEALKRYVSKVLPSLDVPDVPIYTFSEWAMQSVKTLLPSFAQFKLTDDTDFSTQVFKRSVLMTRLIERAVREEGRSLESKLRLAGGVELEREWIKRRDLPLIDRLKRLKIHVHDQGARYPYGASIAIDQAIEAFADPKDTWNDLFTDIPRLKIWLRDLGEQNPSERLLTRISELIHRQALGPIKNQEELDKRGYLDPDDCAILLRITQLKYGSLKGPTGKKIRYEHVMVDEAQDLSPVALQMLCYVTPKNAPVTLAGDTAQRVIFDNGFSRWTEVLPYLPKGASLLPPLKVSYRSTKQIMELARHILGDLSHDWSSREVRNGPEVNLTQLETEGEACATLANALKALAHEEPYATVALVTRTLEQAQRTFEALKNFKIPRLRLIHDQNFTFNSGIDLTDIMQIKGLEYDYIIGLDVNEINYPDDHPSRHLLHILATRAAHQLWLLNGGSTPSSPLLPENL